jgi:dodecin
MTNHTYRVIEIVGTSPDSVDAAIRNGLASGKDDTRTRLVRGAVGPRPPGGRGRRTLPGDAKGRLPARGRLVDRLAGNGSRLGEGRTEIGHLLETVFQGLGGTPPEHRACRDEPGR